MNRLLALCLMIMGCVLPAPPTRAEGEASVMNPRIITPYATPPRARAEAPRPYKARKRYEAPAQIADDATLGLVMPELKIALPAIADPTRARIAVIGDSLAEALASGLESDPALLGDFNILRRVVGSSGLVRDDFHDWRKDLAALVAENRDLAAVAIVMGLNDRQALREGTLSFEPLSDGWRRLYAGRIDALLLEAKNAGIPVIWVGMPIMRGGKLSSDAQAISEIIRERVNAAGQIFVETYDAFADAAGAFSFIGPDIIGDQVRLRGPDGIHFTPAGQRKFAFFIERPLRRVVSEREKHTPAPFQPLAAPASIVLPAGAMPGIFAKPPSGEFSLSISVPDLLPIPFARPRPAIGEIRTLNDAASAPRLVGIEKPAKPDQELRHVFERGLAVEARPGRADDFSWKPQ